MPKKKQNGTEETQIPRTILRSDTYAQSIWKKTPDSAVKTYGEGASAHRAAYAALKHQYEKKGDKWVRKAQEGPSDPQAARGPATRRKSTEEPRAPTAGGKVAKTQREAHRKAKEARKEYGAARRKEAKRKG